MKKNTVKKLWWLWALIALVVVAATVVTAVLLSSSKPQTQQSVKKLYWNVERSSYVALGMQGATSRMPSSDGYYYMKMAVDGQHERVKVEDYTLANQMEFMELMCLDLDENGVVRAVYTPEEAGYKIVADKYVVESITDSQIVCNTSVKYKGLKVTLDIDQDTKVWQLGDFEAIIGMPGQVALGDQIIALKSPDGRIDTIYTLPYVPPGDVYWNITRMWDSALQMTSREPDMFGYYFYDFAVNGEVVTLKTQDRKIADYIDKHASRSMGLSVDENGIITQVINAGNTVCGGGLLCNGYKVTSIKGDEVTFSSGVTALTDYLSKDCKFFDVSGSGSYIGEPADGLKLGDTVTVLKDRRDQVCLVFISGRMTDSDIYWVVERSKVWNRTTWSSDRKPAADGWYYIKLAGNGEQITAKTNNWELVNKVDSNVCWAVKLDGDVIVGAQSAQDRHGGKLFAAYYTVIDISNGSVTARNSSGTVKTAKLSETCEIYDVSSTAAFVGVKSDVRIGDTIYGLTDLDGTVQHLFLTKHATSGYIHWNVYRQYDSKTKQTTRQPAADGYYYFETVANGQTKWLKTNSKEIATKIDLVVTRARGLVVDGDVITAVVAPNVLEGYSGITPDISWCTVQSISGNTAVVKSSSGKVQTVTFSSGCTFYNMTDAYEDHRGEETELRVGDVIVTLKKSDGKAIYTYICGGRSNTFDTNKSKCGCDSTQWVEWDGTTPLTTGHFYLTKDITAPEGGWKLTNGTTYLRLDGHTIHSSSRIFTLGDNSKLYLCGHNGGGTISGSAGETSSGAVIQIPSKTGKLYAYDVDLVNNGTGAFECENGGVLSVSGWAELHDVKLYGGSVSRKGGNLAVMPTGNLEMYGGSANGGAAKLDGSNIVVTGNAYFENVTVGAGTGAGGNLSFTAANKTAIVNGCNITAANTNGQGLLLVSGKLTLKGNVQIRNNSIYNLMLSSGTQLDVSGLSTTSRIGISMASAGTIAENAFEAMLSVFTSDSKSLSVVYEDGALALTSSHKHCVCGGKLSGHSCASVGYSELTQAMFDNATASSVPVRVSGTTYRLSGGNYYLDGDITVAGQIIIGDTVNLCLNGKTVTSNQNRVLVVAGDVVCIADCVGTGKVQGYKAATAATVLVQGSSGAGGSKGTLNIYSGTVAGGETTNAASGQAGNIQVYYGTLNIYGGKLTGGKALGQGGNILVSANQELNIYGGTITDGTASRGNGVYVVAGAKVTLDGNASISSIYLSGAKLIVKSMDTSKLINLASSETGVFAENVPADYSGCFSVSGREVVYDAKAKTLSIGAAIAPPVVSHSHCLCNGAFAEHGCTEVVWEGLSEADLLSGNYKTDGSVYYYLTENVQLTKAVTLAKKKLHICLNGKTVTAAADVRGFILSGSSLSIADCQGTGKVVGTNAKNGVTILVQGSSGGANGSQSTLDLYGGTIVGGQATAQGGAIHISGGTMNMYGGKVEGGSAKTFGGAIFVDQKQYFNMLGGKVTSGTAGTKGKCVMGGANANITVGGSAQIEELYVVSVNKISVSADVPLTDQASIVVFMDAPGVLATNVAVNCAKAFSAAGYTVVWDEAAKTLTLQ